MTGCPVCRDRQLVEITLTLRGEQVAMRSCSGCDGRWWYRQGRPMALSGVYALAGPDKG